MLNKEDNTIEGIQNIVNIIASLNTGLSDVLKESFPLTLAFNLKESFPLTVPFNLKEGNNFKNINLHPE